MTNEKFTSLDHDAILTYWFGALSDDTQIDMQSETCQRWHAKNPQTDEEIRRRFLSSQKTALADASAWGSTPKSRLATTILFDQFSRNMFRDTPAMYATDSLALEITNQACDKEFDQQLPLIGRMFLYMPMMHSENIDVQNEMLPKFRSLVDLASKQNSKNVGFFEMAHGCAIEHRDIVKEFGRFPHRNQILGRTSTSKEIEFLKQDGSAF